MKKDKCFYCPLEVLARNKMMENDELRQMVTMKAYSMLDAQYASQTARNLNDIGLLEASDDIDGAKLYFSSLFEFLDVNQKRIETQRSFEKELCIGALRMLASDSDTSYAIALCRSPQNHNETNVEQAVVIRTQRTEYSVLE